jgi:hypothetical protein
MRQEDSSNDSFLPRTRKIRLVRSKEKFEQKFRLIVQDPEFQRDVNLIRKKQDIDLENRHLIVSEKGDIKPLLKKYKLSKEWRYILDIYILTGEFERMGDPHAIELAFNRQKKFAWMKIYPETTLREIKLAYKTIVKEFKGGKIIKTRKAQNSERDIFILEMRKKGKNYKEIILLVKENYNELIDSGHISRLLEKMKKRRQSI